VYADHFIIAKMFEKQVNSPLKGEVEKQPATKKSNPFGNVIVNYFVAKKLLQKNHMQQKNVV
jgi:hypothetical protein